MKILIYPSVLDRFLAQVAYHLQRRDDSLELCAVVNALHQADTVRTWGARWASIDVLSSYLRYRRGKRPDMEFLRAIEAEYGIPNLGLIVSSDRYIKNYKIDQQHFMLETVFRFLLAAVEREQPQVIFSEGIDCIISYSLYAIARRKQIPFLVPGYARIPGRTSFILNNNRDRWDRTEALFGDMLMSGMNDGQRRAATAYLSNFRNRGPRPPSSVSPARITFRTLKELIETSRMHFSDTADYNVLPPATHVRNRIRRIARISFGRRYFEGPVAGEQYVYFPLHLQPESTTSVLGPFSVDQCAVVENVVKSLPVGVMLYVKEHPVAIGRRPLSYYRRLSRIPAIRLMSPTANSHELIKGAAAVLTISGTAGWEAMIYEKPVIVLGRAFYNASGLTYAVDSPGDLPQALYNAVFRWKPDSERLAAFVAAVLAGTHEGEMVYRQYTNLSEAENAEKIAAGLLMEFRLLNAETVARASYTDADLLSHGPGTKSAG